jgi:hypothetical protein
MVIYHGMRVRGFEFELDLYSKMMIKRLNSQFPDNILQMVHNTYNDTQWLGDV